MTRFNNQIPIPLMMTVVQEELVIKYIFSFTSCHWRNCYFRTTRFFHHQTGNVWTSIFRMINAFIGPALLTLPWAFAQLGWFTGPASLIGFSVLTYHCSVLQAYCYRTGDQLTGQRNYTYMEAVTSHLGTNATFVILKSRCFML